MKVLFCSSECVPFAASGGLEQLVRLLMPYIDKEKARRGARLVVGGN